MKLKVSNPDNKVFIRDTETNYEKSRHTALKINMNSDTFFKMIVDLSIAEGLTCGECYGFQCKTCWRGVAVAYAIQNKSFFEWLHRNKGNSGVRQILAGISQVNEI